MPGTSNKASTIPSTTTGFRLLTLLSQAKSLDYESPLSTKKRSEPRLSERTGQLVEIMATKTPEQLGALMRLSPDLAALNHERFQDWDPDHRPP